MKDYKKDLVNYSTEDIFNQGKEVRHCQLSQHMLIVR